MTGVRRSGGAVVLVLLAASSSPAGQPATELVSEVLVHGNYSTSDAEVLRLAGVGPGDAIEPGTLDAIAVRLRASDRFDEVDVRKRYTSLIRRDTVAIVLVVCERPEPAPGGAILRALAAVRRHTLLMPLVDHAEGHRLTYGARLTLVDVLGSGGTLSVPLTWGGTRRAAIELEKRLAAGPLHVVRGGIAASRLENLHYHVADRRVSAWLGAERQLGEAVRISTGANWSHVRFGSTDEPVATYRVGVEVDTRRNATFPRDGVFARAGWQWLDPGFRGATISMPQIDARGFLGLFGRSVLAVRGLYQGASAAVPGYAQPLLGGVGSVRGHRVGARAGDRLAAASVELRLPLSPLLRFARIGARLFFDTGATYGANERLGRARFSRGAGAGVFWHAAFLALQLDAAHDSRGGARVHFATGVNF